MAVCPDEVADLVIGAVRIVQTARRTNPALLIPAFERRILRAGEVRFQLLKPGPGLPYQLPGAGRRGSAQCFLEIERGVGLPLRDSKPKPGIDGEKPALGRRKGRSPPATSAASASSSNFARERNWSEPRGCLGREWRRPGAGHFSIQPVDQTLDRIHGAPESIRLVEQREVLVVSGSRCPLPRRNTHATTTP